ncbi:hypothetical protein [Streptomyces subrutilus]|uniref:Uncharacterized protein n=1 Tax=Streptomyces subrutilus TaxID=36818 RepID=A0A5P2UKB1_9ACTN|nr:hypothetical protein [Streptomyces subrutilus]QEU79662.1 hypothetical protein CP968_16170 [Streptomyces subrutilus]WSJ31093.1 hypothetical protein OG479_18430 [Streptomyces subrutilus]GGZ84454.1 hypothetical protein GCM10010371_50280 [Streptomyces subrutilus]
MSVGTVIILSLVVAIVAALVLAPSVNPPRQGGRATRRERFTTRRPRRGAHRLTTVPEPRTGPYRRTTG